jgi:hypothetical protein
MPQLAYPLQKTALGMPALTSLLRKITPVAEARHDPFSDALFFKLARAARIRI